MKSRWAYALGGLLALAPHSAGALEARSSVSTWAKAMQRHEQLVVKAIKVRDIDELRRQATELRARSAEPTNWPDEDRWNLARVYCATMAQELANFVDDKLKGTARGEVAAEASLKAYRDAGPDCKRGIQKLK